MVFMKEPSKRALLVGINQYPWLEERYQLKGCVNDVRLLAKILQENFGFPAEQVVVLTDGQARREAILDALDRLVDETQTDDIVVIHFSGHGSQRTDLEGDEPDGLDETILPYDAGRGSDPNKDISDDEIYLRLLGLSKKTTCITLIFDCCHSGSLSRDAFGERERWVEPDLRPAEDLGAVRVAPEWLPSLGRSKGPAGWLPLGRRYVLIAGCRDEERSFEHRIQSGSNPVYHGTLTWFLTQALITAEAGTTYRDIFERLSAQVTAAHPRQHPQMEGVRDRVIFDVRQIEPMRFVPLQSRSGRRVILGAGAAHGMTAGSSWAIYPPGTQKVTPQTARCGLVEISAVQAVTCEATILEKTGTIEAGCRAVEEAHFYGEMRLVVEIQIPPGYEGHRDELRDLLDRSPLLRLAGEAEAGEYRVYLLPPRQAASQTDPVPQLAALAQAAWAVVGQDGRLAMPVHPVREMDVTRMLCDNLEKAARYRQAIGLRNANAESSLKGKVTFILKKLLDDRTWVEVEPEPDSGEIRLLEGERVAIQVTNHFDQPVYISILDFGLAGAVTLLHPIEGASEQLAPGRTMEIGVRAGDELELFMPPDFPYILDPGDLRPTSGRETFKLFATCHPADFSPLVQEGYRGVESLTGAGTPLMRLLEMALTGQGTRGSQNNRLAPDEEWTTIERSFILSRQS